MGATWVGRWEGGRIRVTDKGKRVWMIERSIDGRRYAISLRVTNISGALAELALFNRDPRSYAGQLDEKASVHQPLVLNDVLVDRFMAWARDPAQQLSHDYVEHILDAYLRQWVRKLAALGCSDLLRVSTVQLRQALSTWPTAKKHRVIALKALASWLRDNGFLSSQTDPTLDLKSIKGKRKRTEEEAKAYDLRDVQTVYRAVLHQGIRDRITLCFGHGVHLSELERYARGEGRLRSVGPWEACPIVGTLRLAHKSGEWHTISLNAQGFAAAQRIGAEGPRSRSWCYQHLADVARQNNLPHLLLGSGRHSFTTWCRTPGMGVVKVEPPQPAVSLEDVAAVTGHRSVSTTRFHYDEADHIPHLLELPLRLVNPDDPPLDQVVQMAAFGHRRG